jgi:hypothetical protein
MYRQNLFVPYGARSGPLVSSAFRKVKLATGIAQLLSLGAAILFIVIAAVTDDGDGSGKVPALMGGGFFGLWYLLLFTYAIANMIWLYQFWSWIPPEQRYSSMWKKYISPATAIGFMFIPYFNLYWMFVIYLGIADIMERMRVQFPTSKGPAKNMALLTTIVPMVFFPAGPFLQYFFAKHVEEMASEMQARMPSAPSV